MSDTAAFDPYALLRQLERNEVAYVLIGGLARVLHGTGEVTSGVDITPAVRPSNLRRLQSALEDLGMPSSRPLPEVEELVRQPVSTLATSHGELRIVPDPVGTAGYSDLRRRATRQPIGQGLRPTVAAAGDLARMLEALGRDDDLPRLRTMQRIIELDRGRALEL